jgi:hypothetical protein
VTVWTTLDTVVVLLLTGGLWVAYRAVADRATAAMTVLRSWSPLRSVRAARVAVVKMGALVYRRLRHHSVVPRRGGGRFGWLGDALLDRLALGQMAPGPIVNLSVFVGYQAGGLLGAVVAALGVFAPAFAVVWLRLAMMRLRGSPAMRWFLGVNAGVVSAIDAPVCHSREGHRLPFTAAVARSACWGCGGCTHTVAHDRRRRSAGSGASGAECGSPTRRCAAPPRSKGFRAWHPGAADRAAGEASLWLPATARSRPRARVDS